jgi:hypothetical protein
MVSDMEQGSSYLTRNMSKKNSSASSLLVKKFMDKLFGKKEEITSAVSRTRNHTGRAQSRLLN